jgi:hypothetical protein
MAFALDQSTIEEAWSLDEQSVLDLQRRTKRQWQMVSPLAGGCDAVVSPVTGNLCVSGSKRKQPLGFA